MFRPKNSCHIKTGMSEPRFEPFTLIFNVMEISPLAAVPLIARQKHAYINLLVYIYINAYGHYRTFILGQSNVESIPYCQNYAIKKKIKNSIHLSHLLSSVVIIFSTATPSRLSMTIILVPQDTTSLLSTIL